MALSMWRAPSGSSTGFRRIFSACRFLTPGQALRNNSAAGHDEFAAIIQKNVGVQRAIVFEGQIVAISEGDIVADLHMPADVSKNVATQHGAHAQAQPVVQADRRAIKHFPKPEERFQETHGKLG